MTFKPICLFLTLLSLNAACQPIAAHGAPSTAKSIEGDHIYIAQLNLSQADDAFYMQIKAVAKAFDQYTVTNDRFPIFSGTFAGGEMVNLLREALDGNLDNPYYADQLNLVPQAKLREAMGHDVDFRFFADDKLDQSQVEKYRTQPPLTWAGNPGTIVAVGNTDSTIMILWGVGADGKPMRAQAGSDGSPGPLRFVVLRHKK